MSNVFSRYLFAALVLSFMCSGLAQAACEWNDRINMDDAECLDGGWNNQTWPKKDTAWVQNQCPEFGTVVAKIDRKDAADWTPRLEDGSRVERYGTAGNIRGIHCCSDLSDLCNKSDIINPEGCVDAFHTSEAHRGTAEGEQHSINVRKCDNASATADPANASCTLEADCAWWEERTDGVKKQQWVNLVTARRQITVPYVDVPRLVLSRDGVLSVQ